MLLTMPAHLNHEQVRVFLPGWPTKLLRTRASLKQHHGWLWCWVQRPGWEPEAPWLRLQACLSKLSGSSGESRTPSVLLRTQQQLQKQQDKPVPGTPPSSPVMQRRGVTRLLRSYRALSQCCSPARPSRLGIVHEVGGTMTQPCTADSLQACNDSMAVDS
nr:uncharacterized protein LOC119173400 [Rhipicephalus microplus]